MRTAKAVWLSAQRQMNMGKGLNVPGWEWRESTE